MNPIQLKEKINSHIRENSKLDTKRNYLGMSGIAGCQLRLYNNMLKETNPSMIDYRNSYRGYMYESIIKGWLLSIGFMKPESEKEIIAGFDDRFRGHTDGEDRDGNLIEIKSVSKAKFQKILERGEIPFHNFCQIQAYLKYGSYEYCTCIIVCTETLEIEVMKFRENTKVCNAIFSKANYILDCIDINSPPKCSCGKCND